MVTTVGCSLASRTTRRRSTAPGSANCVAPRPATKYQRRARRIRRAARGVRPVTGARRGRADEAAQRLKRVVRDLARPDQIPQRLEDLRCEPASQTGEELWEEHRAASRQQVADLLVCR